MREVHVDNYKYEDELAFFIQLLNKTTFQEIGLLQSKILCLTRRQKRKWPMM